jgi:DnaK suppressor protein
VSGGGRVEDPRGRLEPGDPRGRLEEERLRLIDRRTGEGSEAPGGGLDLSELDRLEDELREVEDALARLEEGTYGTCQACGRPIEEEHLRSQPAARLCLADQRAGEQGAGRG